jgi:hypothetical protein
MKKKYIYIYRLNSSPDDRNIFYCYSLYWCYHGNTGDNGDIVVRFFSKNAWILENLFELGKQKHSYTNKPKNMYPMIKHYCSLDILM